MPTAPSWLCAEKKSRGSRCCEEYANVDEEEEEENTTEKNTIEKLTREWLAAKIKADLEAPGAGQAGAPRGSREGAASGQLGGLRL
jgi:hypothetical protein